MLLRFARTPSAPVLSVFGTAYDSLGSELFRLFLSLFLSRNFCFCFPRCCSLEPPSHPFFFVVGVRALAKVAFYRAGSLASAILDSPGTQPLQLREGRQTREFLANRERERFPLLVLPLWRMLLMRLHAIIHTVLPTHRHCQPLCHDRPEDPHALPTPCRFLNRLRLRMHQTSWTPEPTNGGNSAITVLANISHHVIFCRNGSCLRNWCTIGAQ